MALTLTELTDRIESLRADYASRAEPGRSGYINPSSEDLAAEEGARRAFGDAEDDLAALLREVQPAPKTPA